MLIAKSITKFKLILLKYYPNNFIIQSIINTIQPKIFTIKHHVYRCCFKLFNNLLKNLILKYLSIKQSLLKILNIVVL